MLRAAISPLELPLRETGQTHQYAQRDVIKLTISNDDENERKRQESCPQCESINKQPGHSHYYCSDCGWELNQLDAVTSFAPANSDPGGLRARVSGRSRYGTTISVSEDSRARRLARTHDRSTYGRPSFVDEIVGEIVRSCGNSRIAGDATWLLDRVNQAKDIGKRRRKMVGCAGMSNGDAKLYRIRVYAAAALHILNDDGRQNTSRHLARDWGLDFRDLVGAIRFLNSNRRRLVDEAPPPNNRGRNLHREFGTIRDYLIQLVGTDKANLVHERGITILKRELELLGEEDKGVVGVGKFTPHSPPKAAFMAAVMAMAELGLERGLVRELYRNLPTIGVGNFVERSSCLFCQP